MLRISRTIIESWFVARSEAPWSDPGLGRVASDRHRLFGAWQANPDARLPIHSYLLLVLYDLQTLTENVAAGDADKDAVVTQATAVRNEGRDCLRRLLLLQRVTSTRYVTELKRVVDCEEGDVDGLLKAA